MSRDRPPPNRSDSFPERFPDDRDPRNWTDDGRGEADDFASESGLPDFAGVGPDTNAFLQALEEEPEEVFRPGSFASNGPSRAPSSPVSDRGGFSDEFEEPGRQPEFDSYSANQPDSNGYRPVDAEPAFYDHGRSLGEADWIEASPFPQPPTHRGSAPLTSEIERYEQENGSSDRHGVNDAVEQPRHPDTMSHRGGFDDDEADDHDAYDVEHEDTSYPANNNEYDDYDETDVEYYDEQDDHVVDHQQQARDDFRANVFDQNIDYYEPSQEHAHPVTDSSDAYSAEYDNRGSSADYHDDDEYLDDGYDDDGDYYEDYRDNDSYEPERPHEGRRASTRRGSYSPGPERILARAKTPNRKSRPRLRKSTNKASRSQGFVVEQKSREHRIRDKVVEFGFLVVPTVLLVLLVRTFVVGPLIVPTESMEPTLEVRDRVFVNKLSYRVGEIGRGDLVVARDTSAESGEERDIVKRVIGLPGEVVEIKDNTVLINGTNEVDESGYLAEDVISEDFGPIRVPQGEIFVLGDNRQVSSDSRNELGTVPVEMVEGRAFLRWWPAGRFGAL